MSTRTAIIIFAVSFLLGIFVLVILPYRFFEKAAEPEEAEEETVIARDQGVFRSDDGGRTWQQKVFIEGEAGSVASVRVNRISGDPADPAALYLATDGDGLWLSRSRGDLWVRVRDGAGVLDSKSNVLAAAVNPGRPGELYAAAFQKNRGRLFKSTDDGITFREVYFTPVEQFGVFDVFYDASRGRVLIATGQGGLLDSSDGGDTWRVIRWFADGLIQLMVSPNSSAVQFVVTPRGSLFRTEDYGATWVDATPAFRDFTGATLYQRWVADSAGGLYVGSQYGLLRSRDDGRTFESLPILIPPDALPVLAVAVDPKNLSRIAVSAGSQLYESRDDGATWAILPPPSAKRITHLRYDAALPDVLYAVVAP